MVKEILRFCPGRFGLQLPWQCLLTCNYIQTSLHIKMSASIIVVSSLAYAIGANTHDVIAGEHKIENAFRLE